MSARDLTAAHEGARVLVCVGPGGVGKTSLAAALAVHAADSGRRVALLTIDPAKRLADALGLSGQLDDTLRAVPQVPGLEAAMLDTRASFDALVARIAGQPSVHTRIAENRVYEAFSRTLARSHAYVAMERLLDLVEGPKGPGHDLVVLDTPPTRSALDILDAPTRLARFAGSSVADSLVEALGRNESSARGWVARGGRAALGELLARVLGRDLAVELAAFFELFLPLRAGFASRAQAIEALLAAPTTRFVLTVAPDAAHLSDARGLLEALRARGGRVDVLLTNRLARLPAESHVARAPAASGVLARARAHHEAVIATDRQRGQAMSSFVESLASSPPAAHAAFPRLHLAFPWLDEAPLDVAALRRLATSSWEFASDDVSS